jgi:uncharacterized membrane protein YqjE
MDGAASRSILEEFVTARPMVGPTVTDPDTGIPDLIRRLTDDSKRLVTDEVQLAKLETKDSLHRATRGVLWMALAFGAGVIMLVALTIFIATLVGRVDNGHMWLGALVTGIVELALGGWLVKKGVSTFGSTSYTLTETRGALKDTAHWSTSARR